MGDRSFHEQLTKYLTDLHSIEEQALAQLKQAPDASPSTLKDLAGRVGGWGMILFPQVNPDSPGKLALHAYSYEHMELAAYELLSRVAQRAGEEPVRAMAERIGAQERAMADRIAEHWDQAVAASLAEKGSEDLEKDLI